MTSSKMFLILLSILSLKTSKLNWNSFFEHFYHRDHYPHIDNETLKDDNINLDLSLVVNKEKELFTITG